MKQKISLLFFFFCFLFTNSFCQEESKQEDSLKRGFHYLLKIQTLSDEKTEVALSRFSIDSIFFLPILKINIVITGIFKTVRMEEETGMPVEDIKSVLIKKGKTIYELDTLMKYKSDIIEKRLFINILSGIVGFFAGGIIGSVSGVGGLAALSGLNTAAIIGVSASAAAGTLFLLAGSKKFKLNGNKENYNQMLLELSGLKKPETVNNDSYAN